MYSLFPDESVIFIAPLYAYLPRFAMIPFYVFGGIFLYASTVGFFIRLAEHAAGSSRWDRGGLITVVTFWCLGLLLAHCPMYFGINGGWMSAFYYTAALVLLVGLAGAICELVKREFKGAVFFLVPIIMYRLPTPRPRTKCWRPGFRSVFKKSPKQDTSIALDELHTDISVVAYRLMIMLFLFSIATVVFWALGSD